SSSSSSCPKASGAACWSVSALDLPIEAKVVRHRRAPAVECVRLRKIAGLPRARIGNVIDIVEVLREAAPRIPQVEEEVRADHVPAEAPARLPALVLHPRGAHRDLVDAADLERAVMEAGALRREQR